MLCSMDGALGALKTLLPAAFLILSPFLEGSNLPQTPRLEKVPRALTPAPSHREPLRHIPKHVPELGLAGLRWQR